MHKTRMQPCSQSQGARQRLEAAIDEIKKQNESYVKILKDDNLDKETREKKIRDIRLELENISKSLFDFELLGELTLQKHWGKISEKKRKEFIRDFGEIIETKLNQGNRSSGDDANKIRTKGIHYLNTLKLIQDKIVQDNLFLRSPVCKVYTILPGEEIDTNLDFTFFKRDNRYIIYDVFIDGHSLILDYRRIFNRAISQKGLEGFLQMVKKRAEEIRTSDKFLRDKNKKGRNPKE